MSVDDVDYVEQFAPGFTLTRITIWTSYINARLRKRYGNAGEGSVVPFATPPESVLGWLTALVTLDVLRKRGLNPADPAAEMYAKDVERAMAELKEAADSKDGLFDLPAVDDGDSAVTTGGPLGYSETSPYVWADIERNIGRNEDRVITAITGDSDTSD